MLATHFALAFVVPTPPSLSLHRSAPITMVAPGAGDLKLQEAAARAVPDLDGTPRMGPHPVGPHLLGPH